MSLKVRVLGSGGAINDGRLYTSLLIGNKVLIDPSPTSIWALKKVGASLKSLTHILITHYHGDHFFGLPSILLEMYVKEAPSELYIVGPYSVEPRVRDILELAFPRMSDPIIEKLKPTFLSLTPRGLEGKEIGGVKLWAFPGKHAIDSYSLVVEVDGRRVGYSGDTLLTDGVKEMVRLSDLSFLDMNDPQSRIGDHMNKEDILTLRREFPDKRLCVIHTKVLPQPFEGVEVADDLSEFQT